jgi:hypothetical protein
MSSWNSADFIMTDAVDNGDGTSLITVRLLSPVADTSRLFVRVAIQK